MQPTTTIASTMQRTVNVPTGLEQIDKCARDFSQLRCRAQEHQTTIHLDPDLQSAWPPQGLPPRVRRPSRQTPRHPRCGNVWPRFSVTLHPSHHGSWPVFPCTSGLGLRSATRVAYAAHWGSWADCLHTVAQHENIAHTMAEALSSPPVDAVHIGTVASRRKLATMGYDCPD